MKRYIFPFLFSVFTFTMWYVGYTMLNHIVLAGKKSSLIHEIHNIIGTDTSYNCESVQRRDSLALSKRFIKDKGTSGYMHYWPKYEGCIGV